MATIRPLATYLFFFFNDTATTEIYTLSLHDALPICTHHDDQHTPVAPLACAHGVRVVLVAEQVDAHDTGEDRKSTRLNSSHVRISYAVFCLKKKKDQRHRQDHH